MRFLWPGFYTNFKCKPKLVEFSHLLILGDSVSGFPELLILPDVRPAPFRPEERDEEDIVIEKFTI